MNDPRFGRLLLSRRQFLQGSATVVAGAYGLSPVFAPAAEIPDKYDGSKFQLKAPEANAKHGGVLRAGFPNRPPHFDLHQSGTFFNLGAMACMFDNLIRRDPFDSGNIIPDLAHSWEIAEDGKTYTFFLRKEVQFNDGAELTAEDVKATFDRIAKPPSGISIPRSILFTSVSEINARDKYTVEFKLSEARPINFMMSAIASGWNVIVRKKTLEDNNYNLRKLVVYPGTGPFRSVRRIENELWVMEKNPNYWNKGLPYLDGIEFYNVLPFSPEMASAILSGRVDYVRATDPVTARKAKDTPGMSTARLLPERSARNLGKQQEKTTGRSACTSCHAPGPRQAGSGRGRQGRGSDDVRRLYLSLLGVCHAQGRADKATWLSGGSGRCYQGSPRANGGGGLSRRDERTGLSCPRYRHL